MVRYRNGSSSGRTTNRIPEGGRFSSSVPKKSLAEAENSGCLTSGRQRENKGFGFKFIFILWIKCGTSPWLPKSLVLMFLSCCGAKCTKPHGTGSLEEFQTCSLAMFHFAGVSMSVVPFADAYWRTGALRHLDLTSRSLGGIETLTPREFCKRVSNARSTCHDVIVALPCDLVHVDPAAAILRL